MPVSVGSQLGYEDRTLGLVKMPGTNLSAGGWWMGIGYRSPILNTPYSQSESSSCLANTQASHYWRATQLKRLPHRFFPSSWRQPAQGTEREAGCGGVPSVVIVSRGKLEQNVSILAS